MADEADLILKIARLHFQEQETQAKIGETLKLTPTAVSRYVKRALDEGYVQIIDPRLPAPAETALDLELRLEHAYQLRRAFVVDVNGTAADPDIDDAVCDGIGSAAARILLTALTPSSKIDRLSREGVDESSMEAVPEAPTVIGIGAGRTVHFVVEEVVKHHRDVNARVVPLEPGVWIYVSESALRLYSASNSAILLAKALKGAHVPDIGRLIDDSSSDLGPPQYYPDVAVFGIGVIQSKESSGLTRRESSFREDPRIYDLYAQKIADLHRHDAIVRRTVGSGAIGEDGTRELYYPTGDILGIPFFVEPPPRIREEHGSLHNLGTLRSLISELSAVINREGKALLTGNHIDHVILAAGGVTKTYAIHHALTQELKTTTPGIGRRKHSLVTDRDTAAALLVVADEMASAKPPAEDE